MTQYRAPDWIYAGANERGKLYSFGVEFAGEMVMNESSRESDECVLGMGLLQDRNVGICVVRSR